ncbi:MAG: gamma-glutamyl-gamma-aminobutyrate hydrolase family protein, partial [Candidatus Moranbacteria bacterium]|nr:gamma-glutamyl-gamma-aminobutyrate hydrolase family protein [Candidatus Moranbacteria bacterium]
MERVKRLLLVQFRTDERGIELERMAFKEKFASSDGSKLEIIPINAFDAENEAAFAHPAALLVDVQGVILGGSAEFYFGGNVSKKNDQQQQAMLSRIEPFILYLFEHDIPTLGICFGHQLLVTFLGEKVAADLRQSETGSFPVRMTSEGRHDPLFLGM